VGVNQHKQLISFKKITKMGIKAAQQQQQKQWRQW
jgi:hypothetical protein